MLSVTTEQLNPFMVNDLGPLTKLWPAFTAATNARASLHGTPAAVMPDATSPPGPPPAICPQLALVGAVVDDEVVEVGFVVEAVVELVGRAVEVVDARVEEGDMVVVETCRVVPGANDVPGRVPPGRVVGIAASLPSSPLEHPTRDKTATPTNTST